LKEIPSTPSTPKKEKDSTPGTPETPKRFSMKQMEKDQKKLEKEIKKKEKEQKKKEAKEAKKGGKGSVEEESSSSAAPSPALQIQLIKEEGSDTASSRSDSPRLSKKGDDSDDEVSDEEAPTILLSPTERQQLYETIGFDQALADVLEEKVPAEVPPPPAPPPFHKKQTD
jgi:hypothetical protein